MKKYQHNISAELAHFFMSVKAQEFTRRVLIAYKVNKNTFSIHNYRAQGLSIYPVFLITVFIAWILCAMHAGKLCSNDILSG